MKSHFTIVAHWSWVVLFLAWLPGLFTRKPTAEVPNPALQFPATALLLVAFFLLIKPQLPGVGAPVTPQTTGLGAIGLALDLVGVAFAIWARLTLGRNWSGLVATVKEDHTLVQSGPYVLVRHPIYTGLLMALLGTALTVGTPQSYMGAAAGLAALLIRVRIEERLMAARFGAAHAAYRERTKKLIPFLW